ncbi:F198A protein, partial [Amia calva]|nr:F198A protein [Amia calva]
MRCKRRSVVAFGFLFTLSVVMINSFPSFPAESHSLTQLELNAETGRPEANLKKRASVPLRSLQIHRNWEPERRKETAKHLANEKPEHQPSVNKKSFQEKDKRPSFSNGRPVKDHKSNATATTAKRKAKGKSGGIRQSQGSSVQSRGKPRNGHLQEQQHDSLPLLKHKCIPDARDDAGRAGKLINPLLAGGKPSSKDIREHERESEPLDRKRPYLSGQRRDGCKGDGFKEARQKLTTWYSKPKEGAFSDEVKESIRIGSHPPPWFSQDDIRKMKLLADGTVVSKTRVPAHGQVLKIGLRQNGSQAPGDGERHCLDGLCALIKRPDDWFEVFAFHLDRVLGLNRSLPVVARSLRSDLLPYKFTSGTVRPVVWWDPDIQHLADDNNDQNSFPLSWLQYQDVLRKQCGGTDATNSGPCVGVRHSEWGKLALFDFLLQVNDRLDRYCCGFKPDPSESCVDDLLHAKCRNPKELVLVHILVRKADPSRLVFIDNAGRPLHPHDNLNFRLLEGIEEFPESAVSVLRSGCLENMLLQSLYTDREFWESRGKLKSLKQLIHNVDKRGKILLQYIQDRNLKLSTEL